MRFYRIFCKRFRIAGRQVGHRGTRNRFLCRDLGSAAENRAGNSHRTRWFATPNVSEASKSPLSAQRRASLQHNVLVFAHQYILAIEQLDKLVFAQKGTGANGDTERKIGGISERSPGTAERRASCLSIERIEPGSSGPAAETWIHASGHERLADLSQSWRAARRQHAVVCVLLGVLRPILQRTFRERLASFARTIDSAPRGKHHHSVSGNHLQPERS